MTIEKTVLLGATADQGIPLAAQLRAAGYRVTAAARRPEAVGQGLASVFADIADAASLAPAFAGQDALLMHLPFEFDRARAAAYGRNIARAAQRAGLRKIVFNTSCFVADRDLDLSAHDGRRDIERALEDTGIPCVFVEPVVFMDNLIRPWSKPSIVDRGVFAYPAAPELRISWVCLDDVAAYMVAALATDRADGRHVPVGGPEPLVGAEVAARLAETLGRPVRFESIAPDEFAARMSELVTGSRDVAPHSIYEGMAKFYRFYNEQPQSVLVVDPAATRELLGVAPTPMRDWLARQDWSRGP